MSAARVAGPAVLLLAVLLLGPAAPAEEPGGVVVTRVAAGSVAERSGLRPGDRLLRWEQGDAGGTLASPFDLDEAELERAPRGAVTLAFEREGATHAASLWPDDWGLEVRPDLPAAAVAALDVVRQPVVAEGRAKAVDVCRSLAPTLSTPADRAWLLLQVAEAEARARRLTEAEAAAADALREAGATTPAVEAQLWSALGRLRQRHGQVADAQAAFVKALALDEGRDAESLALAARLQDRASLALRVPKDLTEAVSLQERATALRERWAPRSLTFASGLSLLGRLLAERGEMSEGLERLRRASALAVSLAPASLVYARCLTFEANVLMASGGLEEAEPMLHRALELQRRREPDGLEQRLGLSLLAIAHSLRGELAEAERLHFELLAQQERSSSDPLAISATLSNLGFVAKGRGDLGEAERRYQKALSLLEESGSGDEAAFNVLVNLGSLARVSHDLPAAESYLRRALAMQERQAPDSLNMAVVLGNLGSVARERGDLDAAEAVLRRSLQIRESKAPEAVGTAFHLEQLATVLVARGEIEEAERLLERALAICEKRAPGGLDASSSLQRMGMLQLELGRLDAAEGRLRAALAIRSELAPDSAEEAESSHALGVVLDRQGRREEALALLRRSVEAIQAQSRRLAGSDDARVAFRAHYQEYHRDLEELLLSLARPEEAFAAAEASRARTLLALMTYRDLDLARDVSPELERERRRADTEHDRVLRRLGAARDAPQRAALRQELRQARQRQDEVRAKIRAAAPRLAAVRDPQPLDLSGVRRVVAPDTLILVYSLGGENSRLYAVGPGPEDFAVSRLQVGEVALREEVRRFREAIQTTRGRLRRRDLLNRSQRLGEILLSPVTAQLARAERVLIVPDGALHALPFAALGLPAPGRPHRFLIQAKPIHTASSVTLYAELARPPEAESPSRQVVGFGDPQYPRGSAGDGPQALRSALRSGLRLDPLPWTRSELKALGLLAPGRPQLWLGAEATEERAKALGGQHRVVHFACHGLLDEAFPLESGLALTIPPEAKEGGDNGLLQAWEIFENLRLDADLVTLSACQTALGKEVAGEGLLGLTWAFQYAGARSVLASLWEVSDASTADLMRHFYGQLGRGVSKAEALRRAQLELLKRPATSAPFYWAAFELIGDGR